MEGVLGVITHFAGSYAPKNWSQCSGQQLSINSNQALYAIVGTAFGGDGQTYFNLPNLQGRTLVSAGQSQGLSNYPFGQSAGQTATRLNPNNLPTHSHTGTLQLNLMGNEDDGIDADANGGFPSRFTGAYAQNANTNMQNPDSTPTVGNTGGSAPLSVQPPYLALTAIICIAGIFPSRN